jgi:DDE superfamily endonuclease/THAP domain
MSKCCYPGCHHTSDVAGRLTSIPQVRKYRNRMGKSRCADTAKRMQWARTLRENMGLSPEARARICFRHFDADEVGQRGKRFEIKTGATPKPIGTYTSTQSPRRKTRSGEHKRDTPLKVRSSLLELSKLSPRFRKGMAVIAASVATDVSVQRVPKRKLAAYLAGHRHVRKFIDTPKKKNENNNRGSKKRMKQLQPIVDDTAAVLLQDEVSSSDSDKTSETSDEYAGTHFAAVSQLRRWNCRSWTNFDCLSEVEELYKAIASSVPDIKQFGITTVQKFGPKTRRPRRYLHVDHDGAPDPEEADIDPADDDDDDEVAMEHDDDGVDHDMPDGEVGAVGAAPPLGEEDYKKVVYQSTLHPIDQCLAALFYLKGELPSKMTHLFNTNLKNIRTAIKVWTYLFAVVLKPDIPSLNELKDDMPTQFKKQGFDNVQLIIDGFDIRIQVPTSPDEQSACYSTYRKYHGFKFILGISPRGDVVYMSKGYPSKATDATVVVQDGLLTRLSPDDAILADKGFKIAQDCAFYHIHLVCPVFRTGTDQFTATENEHTARVANCRIYVENAIGRVRNFSVLQSGRFQYRHRAWLELVVHACAWLTNYAYKNRIASVE